MRAYSEAIEQIIRGIKYMVDEALAKTTKCYDGIVISNAENNKWNVQFNGKTHVISPYGTVEPKVGKMVKIIVPQNNLSLAFFI